MGAWGSGSFENDGALDFVGALTAQATIKPVEDALNAVLVIDDYIDAMDGEEAIVAAEVVALLRGYPLAELPPDLDVWHKTHQLTVDNALVERAIRAMERITQPDISELYELWEEADDERAHWQNNMANLLARLRR